jgi:hypothetical protein
MSGGLSHALVLGLADSAAVAPAMLHYRCESWKAGRGGVPDRGGDTKLKLARDEADRRAVAELMWCQIGLPPPTAGAVRANAVAGQNAARAAAKAKKKRRFRALP